MHLLALDFRSYAATAAAHSHGWHQLVLPWRGELELEIDGRGGRVARGCAAVVGAGARHAFEARGANRFLVVDLAADDDARLARLGERRYLPLTPAARRWLAAPAETLPDEDDARHAWVQVLLHALAGTRGEAVLDALHAWLRTSPAALPPAAALAALAGLSRAQFYRRFAARGGQAPFALGRAQRLERACALLRAGALPIAEVAARCGYADQSALTRALRRHCGLTPGRLRALG
ncbi:transcriptional regulator, AraC family [Mizugakiibacter sediminis]|uniref:Transcriptional regulator, AraC family n=1 Tax=Mizugakiibacter sediminis TaxID=1475481 RepID=A0A0K8QNE1_9GAMM|nr:AraC family transcriptional regulator [Mizugakiibacter sediminis]GAP66216.1 transcriptional regulator, AraC family [Mizugakiibacter sediminis]